MKSIKRILGTGCLVLAATTMVAQSDFGVWTSIEGSTKLNKKLELSLEGEYRTQDMSSMTERASGAVNLSYKDKTFLPFLKADVGYTYMYMHYPAETAIKYETDDEGNFEFDDEGNFIPKHKNVDAAYWTARHRATASLTGSFKLGRFKFALRERYQYTYRMPSQCDRVRWYYDPFHNLMPDDIPEYYLDEDPESDDYSYMTDEKSAKSDHKLRTRLSVDYDIKKCPFAPFAEIEIYTL